jgi:hypothetical protein
MFTFLCWITIFLMYFYCFISIAFLSGFWTATDILGIKIYIFKTVLLHVHIKGKVLFPITLEGGHGR